MSSGRTLRLFSDVFAIFAILRQHNVPVAIASASPARATAVRLLREFGLSDYKHAVVQPGKKDTHLKSIAAALKAPLRRAMFSPPRAGNGRALGSVSRTQKPAFS